MMTRYLAAISENNRRLWLSEAGTWLPKSAYDVPGTPQRVRVFRYAESAKVVAEDWASKLPGYEAHVQEVG
jgi:hypothetical protein